MSRFLIALSLFVTALAFATPSFNLQRLNTWHSGVFNGAVAEISAYDPISHKVFTTNVAQNRLNVFDISDPANPVDGGFISLAPYGGSPNSVAVKNGIVAVAVQAVTAQNPGVVVFFNAAGVFLNSVGVGAVPDMLTFTPDGQKVLVCNEAEPNNSYSNDPDGSVSIIDISGGVGSPVVTTATFTYLNGTEAALRASGIRIYGNNGAASASQDFEPEYLTISEDGLTAWVTLQENNAIAVLDIATATFTAVYPLGLKNWNTGPRFDPTDREIAPGNLPGIEFRNAPVFGMYQPDAIASYVVGGQTYLVTANEGDAREYSGVNNEQARVADAAYGLDLVVFPNATTLKQDTVIGRLRVTNKTGSTDADAQFEQIHAFGARSFSIWNASTGTQVFDSGEDLEMRLAALFPTQFNCTHDAYNSFDTRSDDKGPEPEGVTLATICDHVYAFIALERIGGVIVYDVTNPSAPTYVTYATSRNFAYAYGANPTPADLVSIVELGPEQSVYVPAELSPNGRGLLLLSNEVSGSVSVYQINRIEDYSISGPGNYCVRICGEEPVLIPLDTQYPNPYLLGVQFQPGCLTGSCEEDCIPGFGHARYNILQLPGSSTWYMSIWLDAEEEYANGCFCMHIDAVLPVEFGSFQAIAANGTVTLNWNTLSENNNARFDIERDGNLLAQVASLGNSPSGHRYSFTDSEVQNGTTYSYRLFAVDMNGAREELATAEATPHRSQVATDYRLEQNFPNPFNPSTSISYSIPEGGLVTLSVFDLNGREVAQLVSGEQNAGSYSVEFSGDKLPSGIYYYRLTANSFGAVQKMVLMK